MTHACLHNAKRLADKTLLALVFACAAVTGGAAQKRPAAAPPSALGKRIEQLVAEAGITGKLGIAVADVGSGKALFRHNAELPLNPASNVKLVTAAAALLELKADFCMRTGLYGQIEGDAVRGGLYLKGFGDPSLRFSDLVALATQLAARGVQSVDEVMVDGEYFDDQILPPAFEQKPQEMAAFRAAVAAVSVEENTYTLNVRPGPEAGSRAPVYLEVPGYFELDNQLTTNADGPPSVVAVQRPSGNKMALLLRGKVPLGTRLLSYRRRVADPLSYAGYAMVEALRALRISVPRRTRAAATPTGTALLASRCSPPLGEMLVELGKQSNNFTAEMLLKVLGAERMRRPARSADGATVALKVLKRLGIKTDKVKLINGSGLFSGNLLSASVLCKLLVAVYRNASIRPDYLGHLAIGGVDGTLTRRLKDLPVPGVVRAKTGTLNDVISLSGYVLGPNPKRAVAFSFLANGVRSQRNAARNLADAIATAIATSLWSNGS